MINTVLGEIDPQDLGTTYIHEHLYVSPDELERYYDYTLDVPSKSIEEAELFKAAGGCTIVDMTPLAYGRNPEALRLISKQAGINVLCVTGFHKDLWLPRWFDSLSDAEIARELTREIEDGIGFSKVKPAAVKIGTSLGKVTERERRAIKIVAQVASEHHLPVITHCDKGTMGMEQLDLLEAGGMNLAHVCLSHTDLTLDPAYMKSLMKRGAFLSFDHVGRDFVGHDSVRVSLLKDFVCSGFGGQVCLAGDMGKKNYFKSYGGMPGLDYILTGLKEQLLKEIEEHDYWRMLVENPMHVLDWS
ncbi:aryldialkylphosphatase [Olsenella sp. AF16-14LB]|uniref:phosphotriesterase family protein n=1 Tax=unclassified Olsenella TaxID=2638792 RepID=UPI000E48AF1B|nr:MULTISPECIES: aryldialkylphosphatase [unclassified Olsenella]RGU49654.1 aryldialkylphosphatase [Olsenella sp. AF16-14LB]RGU81476.1 aryldialkylphosphatase [Olsenella sp. AF15-43LB]